MDLISLKSNPDFNDVSITKPIFNSVLEPYLVSIDDELFKYIEVKEEKQSFLRKKNIDLKSYLKSLKDLNREKISYNLVLTNKKINNRKPKFVKRHIKTDNLKYPTFEYNFSFLLNLSYHFTYLLNRENLKNVIDYHIANKFKNYSPSSETSYFENWGVSTYKPYAKSDNIEGYIKKVERDLLRNLKDISKIKKHNQNMLLLFYNYMSKVVEMMEKKKNNSEENTFIKIGYMLVNTKTFNQ